MIHHNDVIKEMKFFTQSEIRLKILSELNKNPNNVRGLVKDTHITYSSISSNIGKLERENYIRKIKNKYHVNPMTKVYFKTLMDFKNSVEMINDYNSFWNQHNINQLSINAIKRITDLKNTTLIETTPIDIYKTHNTIKKQLINSQNVRAIFPYIHPEYPKIINTILLRGGTIELILPQNIFKEFIYRINTSLRKKGLKTGKLKFYKFKNELNLYLTICNKNMSLGLFKNDGSFDQNRILVSGNYNSYKWACDLFEHIKTQVIE